VILSAARLSKERGPEKPIPSTPTPSLNRDRSAQPTAIREDPTANDLSLALFVEGRLHAWLEVGLKRADGSGGNDCVIEILALAMLPYQPKISVWNGSAKIQNDSVLFDHNWPRTSIHSVMGKTPIGVDDSAGDGLDKDIRVGGRHRRNSESRCGKKRVEGKQYPHLFAPG
jgi:hypothetical protein